MVQVKNIWRKKKGNWLKRKILKVINFTTYLVEVDSKVKFVHINKLRKAFEVVDNTNSRLTDNDKKSKPLDSIIRYDSKCKNTQ